MVSRLIKALAAVMVVTFSVLGTAHAIDKIKIGAVAPKTGGLAGGAAVSHWPSVQLWVHDVNAKGGIMLKSEGKRVPIEVIEYDDRTTPPETAQAVQRLINQDKVDFLLPPYGTGMVLAAAPLFHQSGYPLVAIAAVSDKGPEFVSKWDNSFYLLGSSTNFAKGAANALKKLRDAGKIGNRVAVVNVGDAFGIELGNAGRPALKAAGFEIVYDSSYPLGTQDLAPVIKGAMDAKPDAFVAFSYPPDTFALTEQAKIAGFNPKAFYVGVGSAFPGFGAKFGKSAEGVMGAGGINPETAEMKDYYKRHKEVTGKDADYWGGPVTYAGFQMLEQAIEAVGSLDRKAVTEYLKKGTFKTVVGTIKLENNINEKYWTVGQWQNGVFHGIESTGKDGAKEVMVKPSW